MVVLYITEKAVLKLTNCVDAEEFQQLYTEERLRLPFFASIKALRRPSKSSCSLPTATAERQQFRLLHRRRCRADYARDPLRCLLEAAANAQLLCGRYSASYAPDDPKI